MPGGLNAICVFNPDGLDQLRSSMKGRDLVAKPTAPVAGSSLSRARRLFALAVAVIIDVAVFRCGGCACGRFARLGCGDALTRFVKRRFL